MHAMALDGWTVVAPVTAHDDATGWARAAMGGDASAFQRWAQHVTPLLYRLALRLVGNQAEAEDVVQDTLVRAWQAFPSLRDPVASVGWACRMARNAATDRLRQRARRPTQSLDALTAPDTPSLAAQLVDDNVSPEDLMQSQQARALVRAVLSTLPEKHRLVLLLCDLDGLTPTQAALALGVPEGTVDSRLHRARAALARKLRGLAARSRWRLW